MRPWTPRPRPPLLSAPWQPREQLGPSQWTPGPGPHAFSREFWRRFCVLNAPLFTLWSFVWLSGRIERPSRGELEDWARRGQPRRSASCGEHSPASLPGEWTQRGEPASAALRRCRCSSPAFCVAHIGLGPAETARCRRTTLHLRGWRRSNICIQRHKRRGQWLRACPGQHVAGDVKCGGPRGQLGPSTPGSARRPPFSLNCLLLPLLRGRPGPRAHGACCICVASAGTARRLAPFLWVPGTV